ncbi:uncharacterized protein [Pagrus major]|uniref:uncharacterized protein n=1 Tax=Pagrus major TaxID=143350 RepID=UPI003CC87F23
MSSWSSAGKTTYVSPSHEVILSQGGCLTHNREQTLGNELGVMEMSEVEYAHLQHLFQAHMEAQAAPPDGPDSSSPPATVMVKDGTGSTVISPFTTSTQAIDLSTSTDEHCLVLPVEKTPASYGEVPGFVLARVRGEDSSTEPHAKSRASSQNRSRSAARVCLEKRFNTMSAESLRQHDIQSALLSNFLTTLQQSAEAQEPAMHPQTQKWMKSDRANPSEVSSPFIGGVFNQVTNMREQVIGHIPHMVEPKRQCLIIPKSFPFNFKPEKVVTAHYSSGSNSTQEQQLVNIEDAVATPHGYTQSSQRNRSAKAAPDSAGEPGTSTKKRARAGMSLSQRREKHNRKERERRKKIRLCCDELNMLVPFCDSDSDKVTTLQWATAFFRYINNTYGDTFKEEFMKAFTDEKGLILKPCPSSQQDLIHQTMDETLDIPLMVEQ